MTQSFENKGGATTLNIQSLKEGAYLLQIKDSSGKTYNSKFIKQGLD